ncbi:MAG: trans-acting enoyl reductase family protein [Halobacterium sp.]
MTDGDRRYDVVLWGATGFTGGLVAEHFARHHADDIAWAIAGRDRDRLAALRDDLAEIDPGLDSLDVLTGDAFDRDSLADVAEQTTVVCSTVGPYAKYGSDLVAACVDQRTHYCDLAGEVHWMQQMIDEHHERARERGVRVVHGCGFDSVPSDLGTLLVQTHARDEYGPPCTSVRTYVSSESFDVSELADASSGGTMASMSGTYAARANDPQARRAIDNPYSLAPAGERSGPDDGIQMRPAYDETTGQWTAPFIMAGINEKVVYRTNALLDYPWSQAFQYSETTPTGDGVAGAAVAAGKAVGLGAFVALMSAAPLRDLADEYLLPDPGEGPDRETIEESSFTVRLVGTGERPESGDQFTVEGLVTGDRDPGYGGAARMLAESAVCLAVGDVDTQLPGGVLTPATGIGLPLADRLDDHGMTFTVE